MEYFIAVAEPGVELGVITIVKEVQVVVVQNILEGELVVILRMVKMEPMV